MENGKTELGVKALHREFGQLDGAYALREPRESYAGDLCSENELLSIENTFLWDESVENASR